MMFTIANIEAMFFQCECGFRSWFDDDARLHTLATEGWPGHKMSERVELCRIPIHVDDIDDERGRSEELESYGP